PVADPALVGADVHVEILLREGLAAGGTREVRGLGERCEHGLATSDAVRTRPRCGRYRRLPVTLVLRLVGNVARTGERPPWRPLAIETAPPTSALGGRRSRQREQTQLLHQAERVPRGSRLDDLPVADTVDSDARAGRLAV